MAPFMVRYSTPCANGRIYSCADVENQVITADTSLKVDVEDGGSLGSGGVKTSPTDGVDGVAPASSVSVSAVLMSPRQRTVMHHGACTSVAYSVVDEESLADVDSVQTYTPGVGRRTHKRIR